MLFTYSTLESLVLPTQIFVVTQQISYALSMWLMKSDCLIWCFVTWAHVDNVLDVCHENTLIFFSFQYAFSCTSIHEHLYNIVTNLNTHCRRFTKPLFMTYPFCLLLFLLEFALFMFGLQISLLCSCLNIEVFHFLNFVLNYNWK